MKKNKILFLILTIFAFSLILVAGISNTNLKVSPDVYSKIQEEGKIKVFIKIKSPSLSLLSTSKNIAERKNLAKERVATLVGKDNVKHQFEEGISVVITEAELRKLEEDNSVEKVQLVGTKQLFLQQSTSIINATLVWPKQILGINLTGAGQAICIIDSGVNYSHSDLGGCYGNNSLVSSCKVVGGIDYCADNVDCTTSGSNPLDANGHGTHVAGIAAANGSINGVAPGAKIIIIKAANASGSLWDDDIKAGIDWCVQNSSVFNISVISMSFGGGLYSSYCDNIDDDFSITGSINVAVANNISVVVATGNNHNYTAISSPACIRNATRVSATTKSDAIDTSYSNRNSIVLLLAPGTGINSTWKNGGYLSEDGTSMATPHVSGAIALINQYLRATGQTRTPRQIEATLNNTGKRINDNGYSNLNYTRINVYNAIISLDIQSPNVSLLSPANNSISLNLNQTFRCNASDFSLKNTTFFLWNSTDYAINQTSQNVSGAFNLFEINISNLSTDNYKWNCLYTDENNNKAFALSNNSLTILNLIVNLISPPNNLFTNQNQTFSCNANTSSVLSNVTLFLWNSSALEYNISRNVSGLFNQTNFSYNFTHEGNYSWNCLFKNSLNSQSFASSNFSLTYDAAPPQIILVSPANNSLTRNNLTFRCNATDLSLKNTTFFLWNSTDYAINQTSQSASGSSNTFELNISNIPEGNYQWNCQYTDESNNHAFATANYTLRQTPKQVILVVVDGMQYVHFNSMLNAGQLGNFSALIANNGRLETANITGHASTETAPGNAEIHTGLNETLNNVTNNDGWIIPDGNTTFERLKLFNSSIKVGFVYGKTTSYIPNKLLTNALADIDWWHNKTTYNNTAWPYAGNSNYVYSENVSNKAAEFITNYSNNSFYLVVYFGVPDGSGHQYGENSTEYNNSLINVDAGLGILLQSLGNNELRGQDNITQIIVTADHGWNTNTTNHDIANADTLVIPLISNNASIITNRTSDGIREQCEIAPTILSYFGMQRSSFQDIINNGCEPLIGDATPPLITISQPQSSYSSGETVLFNVTLNKQGSSCDFTLDNGLTNRTMQTSDNLTFNSSLSSLSDGSYNVRYYCHDISDNFNGTVTKAFTLSTPSSGNTPGGGGGGGATKTSSNIYFVSLAQIAEGYTSELAKNDKIIFQIASQVAPSSSAGSVQATASAGSSQKFENHSIIINNVENNSVNLTIMSRPITIILSVGQSIKINLTSSDYYDLFIKLEEIKNNKANLTIKNIKEPISASAGQNKQLVAEGQNENETPKNVSSGQETYNKEFYTFLKYGVIFFILVAIVIILIKILKQANKKEKKESKDALARQD